MKVTLKDIAEKTGYSISTVSRVLNGSDKISKTARREIFKTAKRLNYPIYRTQNGEKIVDSLKIFWVVTGFHIGEFYASMFYGLNNAAEKHNAQLSLVSLNKPFDETLQSIKEMSRNYEGLIIFAPEFHQKNYIELKKALPEKYPIVSNALIENPVISTVTFDSYSGGFLAGEHFRKKRYNTCGIIKGPFKKAESRYRSNGFRDYIFQAPDMELCWEFQGDFTFESGIQSFQSFENSDKKPRCIFASNDAMGHGFLEEALKNGYSVPEDVALIGYDDMPICTRHRPTISSIHTDFETLGMVTMEKMKEIFTNPDQQEGVLSLVPVSVKGRKSS